MYVVIDCVIFIVGFEGDDLKCGVVWCVIRELKNLFSYYSRVFIDWFKRGELDRARKFLRAVMKYFVVNDFDLLCLLIFLSELWVMDDDVEDVMVVLLVLMVLTVDVFEFDMFAFGAFGGGAFVVVIFLFGVDFD